LEAISLAIFCYDIGQKIEKIYSGKAMQWLYNLQCLEVDKIKSHLQSKMRAQWGKYFLARVSKDQRQEKRKRILSVRFIFPLSKKVPCVICKTQSTSYQ
jgi:hypothetical protein